MLTLCPAPIRAHRRCSTIRTNATSSNRSVIVYSSLGISHVEKVKDRSHPRDCRARVPSRLEPGMAPRMRMYRPRDLVRFPSGIEYLYPVSRSYRIERLPAKPRPRARKLCLMKHIPPLPNYFLDRFVWKSYVLNLTPTAFPSFRTMRPRTTNFKRRTRSSRAGHAISSTISPSLGSGRALSNNIPCALMLTVVPDPVCVTTSRSRSL